MNPTAEQIAEIYDFPRVMEVSLKALFTAREVKAFTSQMIGSTGDAAQDQALIEQGWDIIDFQKDRPRVEIFFQPGAGQGRFRATTVNGIVIPLETAWNGQFKLDVFTLPDIRAHAAFVTMVRFIMHTQLLQVNAFLPDGTQGNPGTLLSHRIQSFQKDAGTTPLMKSEEGVFQTSLLTEIDFSIQDDAWATLA
jgi:hypothetical protein